jgi:hypothetical protein
MVGVSRIKSYGLVYRIAGMLFMLICALAGGMSGLYFFPARRPSESAAEPNH